MDIVKSPAVLPGRERERLLDKLREAQKEFGYVPREFMACTARSFELPISAVYGLATFYSFLSCRPLGKYVIQVCKSIPCHLKNADTVIDSVFRQLGIKPGQTTSDMKFSFELTNCIGACDMAPAMLLNHELYGNLTDGKIAEILRACT